MTDRLTCAYVRGLVRPGALKALTRAERALVFRHLERCAGCRTWILSRPPGTPEEAAAGERMAGEDYADPEFREAAGLEGE